MNLKYLEVYNILKENFDLDKEKIKIPQLEMRISVLPFESFSASLLPGRESYFCNEHNMKFPPTGTFNSRLDAPHLNQIIATPDAGIEENIKFTYSILEPHKKLKEKKSKDKKKTKYKSKGAIILLHGLNEKDWCKYLPWAYKLMELTGKMIILFPLAFHMNRTPELWSDPRYMKKVNRERKKFYPKIANSSFANCALSSRLQFNPQRFLWSGLQTYFDIIQLIRQIRQGTHPLIPKKHTIDIFAYSVGSFLANILLMTNPYNYLQDSRLFHFCGGPTLNRMSAASRYILDSEANIAVYSYFIEHLELELEKDKRLHHYFSKLHPEGSYFRSMLDFHKLQTYRENRFKELSKQIAAVALKQDVVVPPPEVQNTLQGAERKIPIKVKVMDFDYKYDHVIPFPNQEKIADTVDKEFNRVFKIAARHLK